MTQTDAPTSSSPMLTPQHRARGRGFAIAFLVSFFILWAGVITLHVLGNPAEMFPSPLMPNRGNRAWKVRRIEAMVDEGKPPQIVILGSSRMMQFSPMLIESITGKRAFNFAQVGASPMEYLAQLRYLIRTGAKPEMIIVGIDDRAMLGLYRQWEGRIVEDWRVLRETPLRKQLPLEWKAMTQIRLEQTPDAIKRIMQGPKLETRRADKVENFLLDDGYRIRSANARAKALHPWEPKSKLALLRKYIDKLSENTAEGFAKASLDERQVVYVDQIIRLAQSKHIKVKVICTPMQPYYAQRVLTGKAKKDYDGYVAKLRIRCKKEGIGFYDCRWMKNFKGLDYEFWDEQHPTPVNTMRMTNFMFGLAPETPHPEVPDDAEIVKHPPAITTLTTW